MHLLTNSSKIRDECCHLFLLDCTPWVMLLVPQVWTTENQIFAYRILAASWNTKIESVLIICGRQNTIKLSNHKNILKLQAHVLVAFESNMLILWERDNEAQEDIFCSIFCCSRDASMSFCNWSSKPNYINKQIRIAPKKKQTRRRYSPLWSKSNWTISIDLNPKKQQYMDILVFQFPNII